MQASNSMIAAGSPPDSTMSPTRDLFNRAGFENPLVESLEPAAQNGHAGARRKLAHARLRQRLSARRHRQHRAIWMGRQRMVDRARQHIDLEHHARPAAGRRIVDRAVLVLAKSRICTASQDHLPSSSARPASDTPSGPGNISG